MKVSKPKYDRGFLDELPWVVLMGTIVLFLVSLFFI
jgi:hypothetical protein